MLFKSIRPFLIHHTGVLGHQGNPMEIYAIKFFFGGSDEFDMLIISFLNESSQF